MMHEAARHAIHSYETLKVSVETIEIMQQHMTQLASIAKPSSRSGSDSSLYLRMRLDFQIRMLRNYLLRSQSNKERLQNEIALVSQALHIQLTQQYAV